jgi:hypothetical protein
MDARDPLYCDTDSIFVPEAVKFRNSKELGALKHEGDFRRVEFLAPKLYAREGKPGDWKVKSKGFGRVKDIPDEALDRITGGEGDSSDYDSRPIRIEDFRKLQAGKPLLTDSFSRVRGLLTDPNFSVRASHTEKRFVGKIRPKRALRENGSTRAWDVDELK